MAILARDAAPYLEARDACDQGPPAARAALQAIPEAAPLLRLVELWEIFGADDPPTGEAVQGFLRGACERLSRADPGDWAGLVSGFEAESNRRWGEYLGLLDPWGGGAEAVAEPEIPAQGPDEPGVDASALLQLLMGGQAPRAGGATPTPPARVVEGPAEPPRPEVRAPAQAPERQPPASDGPSSPAPTPAELLAGLDPSLREIFLEEAQELFERIQSIVLELGQGDDAERLGELKRCLHTLKGASLSVGLSSLGNLAHRTEDRLDEAGSSLDDAAIAALESALSQIEGTLGVLAGRPSGGRPSREVERPEPTAPPESAGPVGPRPSLEAASMPIDAAPESPASTAESASDGTLRVPAAKVDELMDVVSELLLRRRCWQDQADRARRWSEAARAASLRLRATAEALSGRNRSGLPDGVAAGLAEQAEDLQVLAESIRSSEMPLNDEAEALGRLGLQLWDGLQSARILPIKGLMQRLVRVARDAARAEGRQIDVRTVGDDIGLDRSTQDRAFEPMLHLVRNAVGHGIEAPPERKAAGKPEAGRISIEARREGNAVLVEIQDDGRGLDHARIEAKGRRLGLIAPGEKPDADRLNRLIFHAGLSTRESVNEVAGRGIGMDVVAREVARLNGSIGLQTKAGQGTRFTVRLPARLALEQAVVFRLDGRPFGLPIEAISAASGEASSPLDLRALLGIRGSPARKCPTVLEVRSDGRSSAFRVDAIDGPRSLVVRPLGPMLAGHPAVVGSSFTTIGEVVLMLSPGGLLRLAESPAALGPSTAVAANGGEPPRALVVDDSISVRQSHSRHLRALGYRVDEAGDGEQAMRLIRERAYAAVLTDLEMPRMDGLELIAELRRNGRSAGLALIASSTRGDLGQRALALGAPRFLPKPVDSGAGEGPGRARPPRQTRTVEDDRAMESPLILVIDDSPTIHKLVECHLSQAGYRVALAGDADRGVERAAELRPDLILLDHQLPGTTGDEVCRRLLASEATARIPVVVSSAMRNRAFASYTDYPNVVDQIPKPFTPELLKSGVANALQMGAMVVQAQRTGCAIPEAVAEVREALLQGDTGAFPLRSLLDFLNNQQKAGRLTIEEGNDRYRFVLSGGRIQAVFSPTIAPDRVAAALPADMADLAPLVAVTLGEACDPSMSGLVRMLEKSLSDPRRLRALLRAQAAILTCWAASAEPGPFVFEGDPALPPMFQAFPLQVSLPALLVEGMPLTRPIPDLGPWAGRVYARQSPRGGNPDRTGLGLAPMKLAGLLDGSLTLAQAAERAGCDLAEAADAARALAMAGILEEKAASSRGSVLIIEEDPETARTLQRLLGQGGEGCQVRVVRDKLGAQLLLRRSAVDLILLPLDDPEQHACFSACRALAQAATRFIGLVSIEDEAQLTRLDALGLDGVLHRPLVEEDVRATVQHLLGPPARVAAG
ncbi:MAG: response regulator [Isosphaeraceae bacterium]